MLERNENIQANICEVQIKSVSNESLGLLTAFEKIYNTPSKVKFSCVSKQTAAGIEYTNKITLNYPGLDSTNFLMFNKLLHLKYVVRLGFSSNTLFEIGEITVPLKMKNNFKTPNGTQITFYNKSFIAVKYVGELNSTEIIGFPYILKAKL